MMSPNARHPASSESLVAVQFRVLGALILRDIKTRFFGNGMGYVVAILWPFAHIVILLTIYYIAGRTSPVGGDTVLFLSTAVVPVICFLYISRFIMMSVQTNQPLLNFPIVKLIDVILARAILEIAAACCVAAMMTLVLFALDGTVMPTKPGQAACAYAATMILGFGIGAVNGVIVLKLPGWAIVYILFSIVIYITSGTLFVPDALPEEIRNTIAWNPLLHLVEWMREAYFTDYRSIILDKMYPLKFGFCAILLALAIERGFRRFIHR